MPRRLKKISLKVKMEQLVIAAATLYVVYIDVQRRIRSHTRIGSSKSMHPKPQATPGWLAGLMKKARESSQVLRPWPTIVE